MQARDMKQLKTFPCAKINLGLNVVARRADGYHDLETVFYPVDVCDELEVSVIDGEHAGRRVELSVGNKDDAGCRVATDIVGAGDDNLVVKAYNLLAADYELPAVRVTLRKGIPVQAGMGGGSSDCAFMLRAMNTLADLGLDDDCLRMYAARLGADCAFFVDPRPAYAEGIGDRLSVCGVDLSGYHIAIVKPPVAVSTREAFAGVQVSKPLLSCREIVARPVETWRDRLHNDFEDTVFAVRPELRDIKEQLYDRGAVYASMSGSGSAIYGIFKGEKPDMGSFKGCFTAFLGL